MPPVTPILSPEEWTHIKMMKEFEAVVPGPKGIDWRGLVVRPTRITFETQNKGEKVYLMVRRHWLSNVTWVINLILYSLLPPLLGLILRFFNISVVDIFGARVVTLALVLYYASIFISAFHRFISWYFNMYLITNERLIIFRFNTGTVTKTMNETRLEYVVDVKGSDAGVLAAFFDFGDLNIYTDAEQNLLKLEHIPEPTLVRDIIADLAKVAARYHFK